MTTKRMKILRNLGLAGALTAPLLVACGQPYYAEDPTFSESGTVAATRYHTVEPEYRTVYRTEYEPVYRREYRTVYEPAYRREYRTVYRTEVEPVYVYRLDPSYGHVYERRYVAHDHKGFISRHHLTYGR